MSLGSGHIDNVCMNVEYRGSTFIHWINHNKIIYYVQYAQKSLYRHKKKLQNVKLTLSNNYKYHYIIHVLKL